MTRQDDAPEPAAADAPAAPRRKGGSFWKELPVLLVIALGLALLIKGFLVQAFYIPSGSMNNTLLQDDRVLVNKLVYDFRDIRRGEVVVFDASTSLAGTAPDPDRPQFAEPGLLGRVSQFLGFGAPGEEDYIKRVIGLPGDRVMCCDAEGRVTVQPEGGAPVALDEGDYLFPGDAPSLTPFCEAGESEASCPVGAPGVLVPEGRLWVMGDHRSNSGDSRVGRTTVPEDEVIGRAFVVIWPLDRVGGLGVPDSFDVALGWAAPATPYALSALTVLPLWGLRRRRLARA